MAFWQLADFAKEIGSSRNTVYNWFKQLEENKIHFVNLNQLGEKVYDELDLRIGKYIKDKRKEKWSIPAIHTALPNEFELRTNIIQKEKETGLMSIEELKKELMKELRKEIEETVKQTAVAEIQGVANQFRIPSPEEKKLEQFNQMMLHRRIEKRLREKAEMNWKSLSEDERTIKTGLFGLKRIENVEKKFRFMNEYVSEHFESELKKELDIDVG